MKPEDENENNQMHQILSSRASKLLGIHTNKKCMCNKIAAKVWKHTLPLDKDADDADDGDLHQRCEQPHRLSFVITAQWKLQSRNQLVRTPNEFRFFLCLQNMCKISTQYCVIMRPGHSRIKPSEQFSTRIKNSLFLFSVFFFGPATLPFGSWCGKRRTSPSARHNNGSYRRK